MILLGWDLLSMFLSPLQDHGTTIVDNLDSQVPSNLICHLETNIGSLEPLHKYCLTKEDLKLLRLGGFIWLSYIPRVSFLNCLNQSSSIEASIISDCPGLTVQKCGFRILYQKDEVEFEGNNNTLYDLVL
ncbi:hypothetical protein SLA2020_437520 [Shorea laevis]